MVSSIDSQQVEKLDTAEAFKQLECSSERLSAVEVQKRLTQFGRNTHPPWRKRK